MLEAIICVMLFGAKQFETSAANVNAKKCIEDYFLGCIKNEFEPYYDIVECNMNSVCGDISNEIFYSITVKLVLEAECVEDIESFQGMLSAVGITSTEDVQFTQEALRNTIKMNGDFGEYAEDLALYLVGMYNNLNEYIGVEQEYVLNYKVIVDDLAPNGFVVYCENGIDYSEYVVSNERGIESQFSKGYDMMIAQYNRVKELNVGRTAYTNGLSRSSASNRANAITYALQYTSETNSSTVCSICNSSSCGGKSNTAYYNPIYYTNFADYHQNDCANYVSQCMYAGKFPVNADSDWYAGSAVWDSASRLTNWMTQYRFWIESDKNSLTMGDVLSKTSGGNHVMIITGYNGTNLLVSGHTNDRKNHIFNFDSLEADGYKFYYVNYLNY